MPAQTFLAFTLNALLSAGGIHGVIVDKIFKPLPLAHSLGVDGIYDLELRDEKNHLHRQMVTREIFDRYQIGDIFDDRTRTRKIVQQPLTVAFTEKPSPKKTAVEKAKPIAAAATPAPPKIIPPAKSAPPKNESRLAQTLQQRDMLPDDEGF